MRALSRRFLGLLAALGAGGLLGAAPAPAAELTLQEVGPGVWAALQDSARRFDDSNSVVLVTDRDVVVVDSQSDPATVRSLIAAIRELTDQPVRYLINSHFHSDHTRGNFLYRKAFPELEIIGQTTLLQDIPNRSAPDLERALEYYRREIPIAETQYADGVGDQGETLDEEARAALGEQIAAAKIKLAGLETIEWALPTLTVDSALTLRRSPGPIELRAVHAHTRGDLVVFLPESKVLITGDVLDDLPYGGHGYPSDWIEVLDTLDGWDWDVMIPGHGSVRRGAEARAHLAVVRGMFALMVAKAGEAAATAVDLETAKAAFLESAEVAALRGRLAGADPVAGKNFDHFVPPGFERAYLEAKNELPD